MKTTLSILLLTAALLLAGCTSAGAGDPMPMPPETDAQNADAADPFGFLAMEAHFGKAKVRAWRGTFSWTSDNGLGMKNSTHADSAHPLEAADSMEILPVTGPGEITLVFADNPDTVEVKRYPVGGKMTDGEPVPSGGLTFMAGPGEYVYEIIARWIGPNRIDTGTAHFAFRVSGK